MIRYLYVTCQMVLYIYEYQKFRSKVSKFIHYFNEIYEWTKPFFSLLEGGNLHKIYPQPAFTRSKQTIETPEQCVKSVQS